MSGEPKEEQAVEKWVGQVNALARDLDESAASLHPSVWPEALAPEMERFKKLAARGPRVGGRS